MAIWNPWRGCHKIRDGCDNCYIHQGDQKRGIDTNNITRTRDFYKPVEQHKNGNYKMKSGQTVYVCFSSDFLLKEADEWREECFEMMKKRNDLEFVFLTKRIHRLLDVLPSNWGTGYPNVTIGVSVSTQKEIEQDISVLVGLPIHKKLIICQPLIEEVTVKQYLKKIDGVIVGGEYGKDARPLDYEWVLKIRDECKVLQTNFEFRQCASTFIKEGTTYHLRYHELSKQAKKAGINLSF